MIVCILKKKEKRKEMIKNRFFLYHIYDALDYFKWSIIESKSHSFNLDTKTSNYSSIYSL